MARIFISHSAANNAAALAIGRWLSSEGFSEHFLDIDPRRGLVAGERWQEALKRAADRCEAIVFLISTAWLASTWCRAEFTLAQLLGKRIFGVLIEPVALEAIPREMATEWQLCDLATGIEQRQFTVHLDAIVPVSTVTFAVAGLAQLKRGLQQAGLDPKSFTWPPPNDPERIPYRGLKPLEAEDAAVFFGRESAIVRGLDELRTMRVRGVERLLVVLGASGAGKSSYLRAGLWPRLLRDDRHFIPLIPIRPHTAAISGDLGLIASLDKAFSAKRIKRTRAQMRAQLEQSHGLAGLLRELQAANTSPGPDPPSIVISIDQGEELLGEDGAEESRRLLQLLSDLLDPPSGESPENKAERQLALAIIAIRSDSYADLQQRVELSRVPVRPFDLRALSVAEFRAVITGPAERSTEAGRRLEIDPRLTDRLLEQSEGVDALPLLAFILERLFLEHGADGDLRLAEYEALGEMRGSVQAAIDAALANPGRQPVIPADSVQRMEAMRAGFIPWLALVDPDTAQRRRRVAQWHDIPDISRPLLERLVDARLLVRDGATIEVAHEALLRQWPLLTLWLDERAEQLQTLEAVKRAAAEWRRRDNDPEWLIHLEGRLQLAERALEDTQFRKLLGEVGEQYLNECREKESALRKSRLRAKRLSQLLFASVSVFIAIAGFATFFQTRSVSKQASRLLTAAARLALTEGHDGRAVRLAILAARSGWLHPAAPEALPTLAYVTSGARVRRTFAFPDDKGLGDGAILSADGKRLLSHRKNLAQLWSLETGAPVGNPARYDGLIDRAAFSPDGRHALLAPETGEQAHLWDMEKGIVLGPTIAHGTQHITSAVFSRDGKYLLTAGDHSARIWDGLSGALVKEMHHDTEVKSAKFSPDEKTILTAGGDGTVRFWNVEQNKLLSTTIRTLKPGYDPDLDRAEFTPDGQRVVTGTSFTLRFWDVNTGNALDIGESLEELVRKIGFSRDGDVAYAYGEERFLAWSLHYKPLPLLRPVGGILGATLLRDRHLAVIATESEVQVWNSSQPVGLPIRHEAQVSDIHLSNDGSHVVTTGGGFAALWEIEAGRPLGPATPQRSIAQWGVVGAEGKLFLADRAGGGSELWDTREERRRCSVPKTQSSSGRFAIAPDGRSFATTFDVESPGNSSLDNGVLVWDVQSCKPVAELRGHADSIRSIAFSADSQRVVTNSNDQTARIWSAADGSQLAPPMKQHTDEGIGYAELSSDGQRVLTVDVTAHLWDARSGSEKETPLARDHNINSARFSRDGEWIVTAGEDHGVRMWNGHTGAPFGKVMTHPASVTIAMFSLDGRRIVTGSRDGMARVWDTTSGGSLIASLQHSGPVEHIVFASDGRRVATSDEKGETRIWELNTGQLLMPPLAGMFEAGGMSRAIAFLQEGNSLLVGNYGKPTRLWNVRWTNQTDPVIIAADACHTFLPGATRIEAADVAAALILNGRAGEDVCDPPSIWQTLRNRLGL
jgi:WD40 repeat protein